MKTHFNIFLLISEHAEKTTEWTEKSAKNTGKVLSLHFSDV